MENPDTTNNAVSDEVAILVDSPGTNITAVVTPRRASSSCQDHHDGHQNDDDDEDQGVDISTASSVPSGFSCKQFITKRLPILKWLPQYNPKSDFFPDLISGVTVGLTAIPQSIAYAGVAGLTPEVSSKIFNAIKMVTVKLKHVPILRFSTGCTPASFPALSTYFLGHADK